MNTFSLSIALLAGVVVNAAAFAQDAPPIDLKNPAAIAAGQQGFDMTCTGYCHGKDGIVGGAPALRGRTDLTPERIHATIANGKRPPGGKIMPAWRGTLSDQQIWELTAFIVSLRDAK